MLDDYKPFITQLITNGPWPLPQFFLGFTKDLHVATPTRFDPLPSVASLRGDPRELRCGSTETGTLTNQDYRSYSGLYIYIYNYIYTD